MFPKRQGHSGDDYPISDSLIELPNTKIRQNSTIMAHSHTGKPVWGTAQVECPNKDSLFSCLQDKSSSLKLVFSLFLPMGCSIKSIELLGLLNNTTDLGHFAARFGSRNDKSAHSLLSPASHPLDLEGAWTCQWMYADEGVILFTSAKVDLNYKPINSLHFSHLSRGQRWRQNPENAYLDQTATPSTLYVF